MWRAPVQAKKLKEFRLRATGSPDVMDLALKRGEMPFQNPKTAMAARVKQARSIDFKQGKLPQPLLVPCMK